MKLHGVAKMLVLFFTRPVKLSDLDVRRWRAPSEPSAASKPRVVDFEPTRIAAQTGTVDAWGRSLDTNLSEQPIHTLPAELQDELGLGKGETT